MLRPLSLLPLAILVSSTLAPAPGRAFTLERVVDLTTDISTSGNGNTYCEIEQAGIEADGQLIVTGLRLCGTASALRISTVFASGVVRDGPVTTRPARAEGDRVIADPPATFGILTVARVEARDLDPFAQTLVTLQGSTSIPGMAGTFDCARIGNVQGGVVTFVGLGTSIFGCDFLGYGLYSWDGPPILKLLDTSDTALGADLFTAFGPPTRDAGDLVFYATRGSGDVPGLYRASGGGVTLLADATTPVPSGAGTFVQFP